MRFVGAALLYVLMASACFAQTPPAGPAIADTAAPAPQSPAPTIVVNPQWIERPRAEDFARNYPRAALRRGVDATVWLDCIVRADGRLNCNVAREDPPGHGFDEASLAVAQRFLMPTQLPDGKLTEGGRVRIPLRWRVQ